MPEKLNKSIYLKKISENEVIKIVEKFSNKSSSGIDMISQKLLKQIIYLISPTLSKLINASIEDRIYPDCLKIAKNIPIYKSGEKHLCNNYRPISLLSVFNKIFEKKIHNDIYDFIEKKRYYTSTNLDLGNFIVL